MSLYFTDLIRGMITHLKVCLLVCLREHALLVEMIVPLVRHTQIRHRLSTEVTSAPALVKRPPIRVSNHKHKARVKTLRSIQEAYSSEICECN